MPRNERDKKMETFANLPQPISDAIAGVLLHTENSVLASRAAALHERYMNREKLSDNTYIQSSSDVLAYIALRAPATYAQIYSALLQVTERLPDWKPVTVLDIGCGPGTGVWAAKTLLPSLQTAVCVDCEKAFLDVGMQISKTSQLPIAIEWQRQQIKNWIETNASTTYDLIIVANVFNELSTEVFERLIRQVVKRSSGIVLIVEPGTSAGYNIIQTISKTVLPTETLIAPYIHSFVESTDYWIHFPQKFKRPEFQRRIRQSMREGTLMASDWEEAKYSFVAFGKMPPQKEIWGRCVEPVEKQKGFLTVPVLTKDGVTTIRILKRNKQEYRFAKELRWGECIDNPLILLQENQ
jgi:ribosomal protein RSM22 (predicted rRNA methylase)